MTALLVVASLLLGFTLGCVETSRRYLARRTETLETSAARLRASFELKRIRCPHSNVRRTGLDERGELVDCLWCLGCEMRVPL